MAATDRQHTTDFIRSAPGRGKSWRDWFKCKQRRKQQHEAEAQEEEPTLLRKAVSFAPVIETFHTLALADYTTEEIRATWFSENDYDDFTYSCEQIRTVSFAPIIETFHTLVALDDYTPEISASWFDEDVYDDFSYNCEKIRTVSFAPVIETFHTLALDDYTPEEISASWFDDDDYDDITYNYEKIISKMNNKRNGSIIRNKDCIRGLERMTDIGLALLNCNRNDSDDAVLDEQDVQWDNQEDDHGDRIARLYREVASRRCHVEAHQRGMQDALVVAEFLLRKIKDEKFLDDVLDVEMRMTSRQ